MGPAMPAPPGKNELTIRREEERQQRKLQAAIAPKKTPG